MNNRSRITDEFMEPSIIVNGSDAYMVLDRTVFWVSDTSFSNDDPQELGKNVWQAIDVVQVNFITFFLNVHMTAIFLFPGDPRCKEIVRNSSAQPEGLRKKGVSTLIFFFAVYLKFCCLLSPRKKRDE